MYSVNGGATVYYAKDILGDRNLVGTINGIFNIVQIAGMFFIAMLVKKYGKRNVFAIGLVLDIIGMLILNFSNGMMGMIVVSSVIRGVGNACGGATMWAAFLRRLIAISAERYSRLIFFKLMVPKYSSLLSATAK